MKNIIFVLLSAIVSLAETDLITSRGPPCDDIPFPYSCGKGECDIKRPQYCDGNPDCRNGADEISYNTTIHSRLGVNCSSRSQRAHACFLPNQYKCDHEIDCDGGIDECGCESTFQCKNGDCALKVTFCDGNNDCRDGTDEIPYNRSYEGFQCHVSKRHVTLSCVLPEVHVCDGSSECNWGTDECFCAYGRPTKDFVNEKCFRCLDGTLVIPSNQVCDGVFHCKDLSDECLCGRVEQRRKKTADICDKVCMDSDCGCPGQLRCKPRIPDSTDRKMCLASDSICDDIYDCADGIDENYCPFMNETFQCLDGSAKVRKNVVCDDIADCLDGSDEKNCHETKYVCDIYQSRRFNWTHHIARLSC